MNTDRYKVFASTDHPGAALQELCRCTNATLSGSAEPISAERLLRELADKDGIIAVLQDKFNAAVFAACPQLKVVGNVAVGYDNIDISEATRHGVLVTNTPGVLDDTTADLAFALLMSVARRIVEADRFARSGQWKHWRSDLLLGTDVSRKTIGIIGMGRIGQAMARRARGFAMNVVYTQRNRVSSVVEDSLQAQYMSMEQLLGTADFVSLHCPLNENTRHLIGEKQLALMKSNAFLINTARGPIVDEVALVKALQARSLAGAGLDVFEREPAITAELLSMDNVVLAPHVGSATVETRSAMASLAVSGVLSALRGELPENAVNPEVWPEFIKRLGKPQRC